MSDAAIAVEDLRKSYRSGIYSRAFPALKGVTFEVQRGEIFGLLGPNGAGKTTLIKILLGVIRRSGGSAFLLGAPAGNRASRLRVGYLPENLRISPHHTALTAMEYYGRLSGLKNSQIKARRLALLENVGLDERARDSIKKYSKGMLQRLGLAQALLHDPDLLILDEPTDGLDPVGRSHVRNVLRELKRQGKTVFLNSHLLQEVELICDRVAILDQGLVRAIGNVDELAADPTEGVELELTLAGTAAGIQEALGDRGVKSQVVNGDGDHELQMRLMAQVDVDAVVDDLRQGGVSIIGLRRKRVTLEDTFLSLFAETPDGDR